MKNKTPLYNKNYEKVLENEDSEDGYISPQDISIKDEKIWDPTDEEILSYALKLGYDIEKDPDELFEVAYYYMKYPLPEGWKRGVMKNTKELVYVNFLTGEIEVSTEIEEMAHQMYLEKKSEMNQKNVSIFKKSPEKKETTTVVPRKKIPPLNPLQKSNNSTGIKSLPGIKESNIKDNKNNDLQFSNKKIESPKDNRDTSDYFKNEKLINLNNNIDKFLEQSINEKEFKDLISNNKDKNDKKEINYNNNNKKELKTSKEENKKQNYDYLLNLGGVDDDDEEIEEDEDEEDKEEKDDKEEKEDSFLKQMLKKEKEIEQLRKEKEKAIENAVNKNENLKNIIDIKKIKCESEGGEEDVKGQKEIGEKNYQNIELFKEKKEYLKKKLDELKKYKEEIKVIYEDKKDKYEKEKKEKKNYYDNKLKEELNSNKKKLEKQFKDKLELYEKQLINKKQKEEKRYNDELINNFKSKKEENKELIKKKEEKQKEELKQKKNDLLKKIDNIKKLKLINNSNLSQKKINFQKNTLLLEEKINLEKKNKTKKYEIEIKNIENQLEKEFQQKKQNILKNFSQNISFMPSRLDNTIPKENTTNYTYNNNELDDISKLINEEYDINCKAFEQELENKKLKEIEKYTNKMDDEKKDQLNYLKNEINTVEKDYYKSISNIRNNSDKNKLNNENNLKIKFEQTLNDYEHTKNDILEQNQQLMKHINSNLHNLLISNYTLKQTENKLEEFLLDLKDTYLLILQKNKNNFEMYENEYIFKTQFIKYLLEIVNYINELFISEKIKKENNNDNKTIEQNIADKLLLFCKEKIKEYRKKYKKVKNSSIFRFMNGNFILNQSLDNTNNSNMLDLDEINKTILFDLSQRKQLKNIKLNSNNNKYITSEITSKDENNNNNINSNNDNAPEITFFVIDQQKNYVVPMVPENILSNLNEDILLLYQDIVLFLKNEYNKIVEINNIIKENKDNKVTKKISTNLNIIIIDKIKSYTEESFIYLMSNYNKNEQILNIKKKLRLILNHIEDYKNNFDLDKYLTNIKINMNKNVVEEEKDIVNNLPTNKSNIHINNYISNKEDMNMSNFKSRKFQSVNDVNKEKEEQKQNGSETNLSRSIKINSNKGTDSINGRFNNFYRQYNSNSLVDTITNPFSYQFFNYKKNKYELDKSLGKISIP